MTTDAIAHHFHAKRSGLQWMAMCPAHDDQRASLAIAAGHDGKTLLKCHAGCITSAILAAAHLSPLDLFPERLGCDNGRGLNGDPVVATYEYVDEHGAPLYAVERTASKQFRAKRRLPDGSFVSGLGDTRRVLYRLNHLSDAPAVAIVEGEKDADTLVALGLPATTAPFGASAPWLEAYTQQLTKAGITRAAVFRDEDDAGRTRQHVVAKALHAAAFQVRCPDLPDLPPGGDVSDWLATHSREDLLALLRATPAYGGPPTSVADEVHAPVPHRGLRLVDDVELADMPDPVWHVEKLFPYGALVCLYGGPGVGKTTLMADLALCVAIGAPFLGLHVTTRTPVAYIAGDGLHGWKKRLTALKADYRIPADERVGIYTIPHAVTLTSPDQTDAVITALDAVNPGLVIVDTMARAMVGSDDNMSRDIGLLLEQADRIRAALTCTFMLIHHTNKGDSAERGSTALRGAVDTMLCLSMSDDLLTLDVDKQRDDEELRGVQLRRVPTEDGRSVRLRLAEVCMAPPGLTPSQKAALDVLAGHFLNDGATKMDWQRAMPAMSARTFFRASSELVRLGRVRQQGGRFTVAGQEDDDR